MSGYFTESEPAGTLSSEGVIANGVRTPVVPEYCEQAWHMYYLLLPTLEARTEFIARLKEKGVTAVFHYLPLHLSRFAESIELGAWSKERPSECPVTEDVSDRIVRLPFFTSITEEEQQRVIGEVKSWQNQNTRLGSQT